jgi:hypothetical protein
MMFDASDRDHPCLPPDTADIGIGIGAGTPPIQLR